MSQTVHHSTALDGGIGKKQTNWHGVDPRQAWKYREQATWACSKTPHPTDYRASRLIIEATENIAALIASTVDSWILCRAPRHGAAVFFWNERPLGLSRVNTRMSK